MFLQDNLVNELLTLVSKLHRSNIFLADPREGVPPLYNITAN